MGSEAKSRQQAKARHLSAVDALIWRDMSLLEVILPKCVGSTITPARDRVHLLWLPDVEIDRFDWGKGLMMSWILPFAHGRLTL